MANESVYIYGANSYVDYDSTPAGTLLDIPVHIYNYGASPIFNATVTVDGVESSFGLPAEGLAPNTEAIVAIQYAVKESERASEASSVQIIAEFSYDDAEANHMVLPGELTVNIRNKPTEYAIFFRFWRDDFGVMYEPESFEIEVTKDYDGVPFTVSADATFTRSGYYKLILKSLPEDFTFTVDDTKNTFVPGHSSGAGMTIEFFVSQDAPAPTGDDFVDMALTRQTVGQPWSWS